MTAEFYIIPESFENAQIFSKDEIEEKIKALAQDFVLIKQYKDTNKIYVNPQIYSVVFIGEATILDLLYNPAIIRKHIDRDVRLALQKIIGESATTDVSSEEIIEILLPNHNEERCYGLIAFNKMENIKSEYQIVYNINDWYAFSRYFLGLYPHPQDGNYFIEECKKYFPCLFFHERNKETVTYLLKDCSQKTVYHLGALNDKFKEFSMLKLERAETLKRFSIAAKLDEEASLEGDASRKGDFNFDFVNDKDLPENVCCEPHLKLCYNDNYPGDTSYSTDRRIYFHEGKPNIQQGKVLIGHMGKHL
jgi:hypothetical protein